ncbi:MAG: polysaccharide export protein [Cellvibrionaceae bacterium]|nr:polysaccharide export protein [Cellvibrionaceae bacterium]
MQTLDAPVDTFVNPDAPTVDAPINSYRLNKGDQVRIVVFGEPDLSIAVQLDDLGAFSYPYLGELMALGKRVSDVQQMIVSGLQGDYLVDPKVSVSVVAYREIFVSGEVSQAGDFPFQPGLSVGKAIALAGGFTHRAAKDSITVVSENAQHSEPKPVDFDYQLNPGDVVNVPAYQEIFVSGEVSQAGNFPYRTGLTVEKAITLAGGFTERAAKSRVKVVSEVDGIAESKMVGLDYILQPGDVLTIPRRFF